MLKPFGFCGFWFRSVAILAIAMGIGCQLPARKNERLARPQREDSVQVQRPADNATLANPLPEPVPPPLSLAGTEADPEQSAVDATSLTSSLTPITARAKNDLPPTHANVEFAAEPAPGEFAWSNSAPGRLERPQEPQFGSATRPLALAVDAFLRNRPEEAIRHLEAYGAKDQEFVLRLLPLLSAVDQGGLLVEPRKADQMLRSIETLREIERDLRPLAPLTVDRLVFCHEIKSYGRYTPVQQARFIPGESKWLYAELGNLVDQRGPTGAFTVRLKGMIELHASDGTPIGPVEWMHSDDSSSSSPRQDYFVRMDFRVPPHLPAGQYTVRVRIDDLHTGRAAEATLPFQVSLKP